MTRCIEANRPPGGLTVHLVAGHAVDLHIAGVTAGTLHWADGRRVEVAPSLPGTASVDGLGWSLDGDLTAQLRAAGVVYVQLVDGDRVLLAGGVTWWSGWSGDCRPHQSVTYVPGVPGAQGVGIDSITADAGTATITLTDGTTHTIDLPPGEDGHSPVVGLDGDRLTVDGVPVGDSLRGPAGHAPEVVVDGDIITVDGQSTDPLTGPPVATRWEGTALVVGDLPPVELASTVPGPPGGLTETPGTVTRGAATTQGTLTLTRLGRTCTLTADGIRAGGTSAVLGSLPTAADRPAATTKADGWLTDATAANAWGVTVGADGALTLTATPAAATILSGSISWRAA